MQVTIKHLFQKIVCYTAYMFSPWEICGVCNKEMRPFTIYIDMIQLLEQRFFLQKFPLGHK